MQEIEKNSLSPTRLMKKHAAEAIGSATFHEGGNRLSLNLFNLPDPDNFREKTQNAYTYKGWLFNPTNGAVAAIGKLEPAGEGLYLLYDTPLPSLQSFSEVIITAEEESTTVPRGEILLIGYLPSQTNEPLAKFEPFTTPLPGHKWWKMKHREDRSPTNPCRLCPDWQRTCFNIPAREKNFDLPEIIGLMNDDTGNILYMIHGIPGRLLKSDQPDGGRTGYLHWRPYYGLEERIGTMGYWLCYLDPRTNHIATPLGVTIPPG